MNREEAANILDLKTRPEALADFVGPELAGIVHQAMRMGAEALRSRWVKTLDRLPTEADADNTMCWVLATTISSNLPMPEAISYIRANPDNYPYWMPIPPLPEVEE